MIMIITINKVNREMNLIESSKTYLITNNNIIIKIMFAILPLTLPFIIHTFPFF